MSLKPFVNLAIFWKSNSFFRAKISLSLLYMLIISFVLGIFSYLIFWYADKYIENLPKISRTEAIEIFNKSDYLSNQEPLENSEISLQSGQYVATLRDGKTVSINAFTGKIFPEGESLVSWQEKFRKNFIEKLFIFYCIIFFIGIFLSYFLSGKTLKPIQEKIKEQDDFVSNSSHELRNPISAIQASAESVLRMKKIPENISREVLSDILSESLRLVSLSNALLNLNSANITPDNKNQKLCNIKQIIEDSMQKLSAFSVQKNINFSSTLSEFTIQGVQNDFEIVFFNLLHNAIKFSSKNSSIVLNLEESGYFSISNSGKGISSADLPHIFDRFYKGSLSREFDEHSGSGLGLSIVKKILTKYNKNISISSKNQNITTVSIEF